MTETVDQAQAQPPRALAGIIEDSTSLSFVSTSHFEGSRGGRLTSRRHCRTRVPAWQRLTAMIDGPGPGAGADVLSTVLPGPGEVRELMLGGGGAAAALRRGTTWIDMTANSAPGAASKGQPMYIGIGTVVLIVIIVLAILMLAPAFMLRRCTCERNPPHE
jgi:hypothetical protein